MDTVRALDDRIKREAETEVEKRARRDRRKEKAKKATRDGKIYLVGELSKKARKQQHDKAKRAAESEDEKRERRDKRNERDRARRRANRVADEMNDVTSNIVFSELIESQILSQHSDTEYQRSIKIKKEETEEERVARLQHLSTLQQLRMVTETDKERDVRLEGKA